MSKNAGHSIPISPTDDIGAVENRASYVITDDNGAVVAGVGRLSQQGSEGPNALHILDDVMATAVERLHGPAQEYAPPPGGPDPRSSDEEWLAAVSSVGDLERLSQQKVDRDQLVNPARLAANEFEAAAFILTRPAGRDGKE